MTKQPKVIRDTDRTVYYDGYIVPFDFRSKTVALVYVALFIFMDIALVYIGEFALVFVLTVGLSLPAWFLVTMLTDPIDTDGVVFNAQKWRYELLYPHPRWSGMDESEVVQKYLD